MTGPRDVSPGTIKRLWLIFCVVLATTIAAELFIHRHAIFGVDGLFAFNALYGFVACVALVAFAKLLGIALKRADTYYDD